MEIKTEQFGMIHVEEDKIVSMPGGMPGFLGRKRFVIIEREETWPFCIFQCVDDQDLSFFMMNPFLFKPDYTVDLDQAMKEMAWPAADRDQIKIYAIVNTSAGVPEKITANLLGPLIINATRKEAVQRVLHNSPYSHKHLIFGETSPRNTRDVERRRVANG